MNTSSEINERLVTLVKHFTGGNAAAFARSIQVAQQRFDRLLKPASKSGKYPMIKPEMAKVILAKYPTIQEVWFLSGFGPMLCTLEEPPLSFSTSSKAGVPYYPIDFVHEFDLIQSKNPKALSYHINFQIFNHADFWCHVNGRSMEPEISSGDIVAMKELSGKEAGIVYGEVYGIITKNFCTIRRVAKGDGDRFLKLIPSNKSSEYAEQEIPRTAIEHIFQVLCCVKKL